MTGLLFFTLLSTKDYIKNTFNVPRPLFIVGLDYISDTISGDEFFDNLSQTIV
jgi:hypothetical protein